MKRFCILFSLVFLGFVAGTRAQLPTVSNGELDLRGFNIVGNGLLKLNGNWQFYEGALIKTYPATLPAGSTFIKVPDSWNKHASLGRIKDGKGYGSYRLLLQKNNSDKFALMIRDISSCYKLWINNELVEEAGRVDTAAERCLPRYKKASVLLNSDTNFYEIVFEVANFNQHNGGIRTHINLLRKVQINLQHERESLRTYFCLGIIFIIGLYQLGLFLMNKKDLPGLNFGLFCLVMFIFLSFRTRLVYYFIEDFDWELGNKIEYLTEYIALPLFYIFFYRSFPNQFKRIYKVFAIVTTLLLAAFVLATKTLVFSYSLDLFYFILHFYVLIVSIGMFNALRKKEMGARILCMGFVVFSIALVNDVLHVENLINTDNYITYGVVGFILCQAYYLAFISARDKKQIVNLSVNLNELNKSLSRFVPSDFMRLLNKSSITEVSLGNNAEREMTIMFSDIRAFTSISEQLSPSEAFAFINEYLKKMAPIIRKHGGFIDKYLGDGIMALFPNNPNDAILAAKAMLYALEEFNSWNEKNNKPQIAIGIGLHTGLCILGTVGEPMRMDTTVISDAVNLAARIESLTKFYKTPIIISQETYKNTSAEIKSYMRFIGEAQVKGKSISTKLYKVFFDHQYNIELLNDFDTAISLFYNQQFGEAAIIFEALKSSNLYDGVLQMYLDHSLEYSVNGPPKGWKTFEVFEY